MRLGTVLPLDRDKWPPHLLDLMFWVPQISKFLPLRPAGPVVLLGQSCHEPGPGFAWTPISFWLYSFCGVALWSARPCACRSCDWVLVPGGCPGKQVSLDDWCSFCSPWMARELAAIVVRTCWFGVTLTCTEWGWVLGSRLLLVHCSASGLELYVLASTMLQPLAYAPEGGRGGGRHLLPCVTPTAGPLDGHPSSSIGSVPHVRQSSSGWVYCQEFLRLLFFTLLLNFQDHQIMWNILLGFWLEVHWIYRLIWGKSSSLCIKSSFLWTGYKLYSF